MYFSRLSLAILLSAIFHLAILSWHVPASDALPKVNVNPGKTSVSIKMQTQSKSKASPPEMKEIEEPEKNRSIKPEKIDKPNQQEQPIHKKVPNQPTTRNINPVTVEEPSLPEPDESPEPSYSSQKNPKKEPTEVKKPSPPDPAPNPTIQKDKPNKKKMEKSKKSSVPKKGVEWVKEADYRSNPSPNYPETSRKRGDEGTVILRVNVDKDGKPTSIKIRDSSGHPKLDQEAMKTVKNWTFTPAKHSGTQIQSTVLIPVTFQLN